MIARYRVLIPAKITTPDGQEHTQGDEFEMDQTAEEQADLLAWRGGGLLEIVPQTYRVISDSRVHETNPGDTFDRGLTIGEEELLVAAGHIERVKTTKKRTKEA